MHSLQGNKGTFINHVTPLGMDGSSTKMSQMCHKGGRDNNPICHVTTNHVLSKMKII